MIACLQITGSNFYPTGSGVRVTVGDVNCPLTPDGGGSYTTIKCTAPAKQANQAYDVKVTVNGQDSNRVQIAYGGSPTLTSITPSTSVTTDQVQLNLQGSNWTPSNMRITLVKPDGSTVNCPVLSQPAATSQSASCTAPAGLSGSYTAYVTTAGTQTNSLPWVRGPPDSYTVTPNNGLSTAGTTSITITGFAYFPGQTTVTVGGQPCSTPTATYTTVTCTAPALPGGQTYPVVVTVGGTNAKTTLYVTYEPPVLTSVTPSTNVSTAGGTM